MTRFIAPLIHGRILGIVMTFFCLLNARADGLPEPRGGAAKAVHPTGPAPVVVKGLDLSRAPTPDELATAGQLGGRLFPTRETGGQAGDEPARRAFGEAIQRWNRHEYPAAVGLFRRFVQDYPQSAWAAEASLHIGCDAVYNGRQTEAEGIFTQILRDHGTSTHPGAQMLASKALQRLATLEVERNNLDRAVLLFRGLREMGPEWRHRTYASHWLQRLSQYAAAKETLMKCGSEALAYALERQGQPAAAARVRAEAPVSMRGQAVLDLVKLSTAAGRELVAVEVTATDLSRLPLPAILHIGADTAGGRGHYWVLDKAASDHFELFDPQSQRRLTQTPDELTREWSGTALIFPQGKPVPGRRLAPERMAETYGGCCGVPRKEDGLGNPGSHPGSKDGHCSEGAPEWAVNVINLNFFATDTPLWYNPAIGPSVRITLSYNSQSAIAQFEPFGNKWQFNYGSYLVVDTAHTVLVFMPDGRRDSYTPDGAGGYLRPYQVFNTLTKLGPNRFELRFPDDTVYVYQIPPGTASEQPFLTEIRDAHSQKLTFGYDADVHLVSIKDAQGLVTTLSYNSSGLVTNVADPFGRRAAFEYNADGNLVRCVDMGGYGTSYAYDDNAYLTALTDERGTWMFKTEPADGIDNGADPYPAPGAPMYENYRITITDPDGYSSEYHYNGYSSLTWYVSPRHYRLWRTSYDNNLAANVPRTIYHFAAMNVGRQGAISQILFPEGDSFSFDYDPDTGDQTSIADGYNNAWTYTYNALGRVTSTTSPKGDLTSFTYADNGVDLVMASNRLGAFRFTWDAYHEVTSITDRLNHRSTFAYNAFGQLTNTADPLQVTNIYVHDAGHRLAQIQRAGLVLESFTYDAPGRVLTHTDATGLTVTNQYSPLDQLTRIAYPDGRFESFAYSSCCPALLESVTDRGGRTTTFIYDSLKRLVQRVDSGQGLTQFEYDPDSNPVRVVDPNGSATLFTYDLDNRLASRTRPDGGVVSFSYDDAGLLAERLSARGITTRYTYDENHDLTQVDYSDGTPSVTNVYDNFQRVVQVIDGLGATTLAYDADSRLLTRGGAWPNDTITYGYDPVDRATNVTVQLGQSVGYAYDALNRLTQVQTAAGSYLYSYAGASPLPQKLLRPNGSYTISQYDTVNRLTLLSNQKSSGEVVTECAYTYTAQDVLGSESVSNGLAVGPVAAERLTYAYNAANQLTVRQPGPQTFAYDADGNLVAGYTPDGLRFTATYDAENRLTSLQYTNRSGQVCLTEYAYHADGGLAEIIQSANGVVAQDTKIVADRFFSVQDRDGISNTVLREYAWGLDLGGGIGGLLDLKAGPSRYAYLYDGRGNVTSVLGGDQSPQAAYAYQPFGELARTSGTLNQPMRFSTKRYDDPTGLVYFGVRFYSPLLGVWLTRDPLPRPDDAGPYRYVDDNPIQSIDPVGLDARKWSNPWQKSDDYGKALDPSKKGGEGAAQQGCALKKAWKKAAGALGGDEGSSGDDSSAPSKRGKPKLSNYPNK